jgi:ectoine hydroxylase-related dioxygenase (phytanoyl-CoA dioxygenase family)
MIQWPNNQGYDILDKFLTKEEYEHYYNVCKNVYNEVLNNPNKEEYCWNDRDELNLNKIEGACKFEPEFLKLASHPSLVEKAKKLLNTSESIDVYISKFFPMKAGTGHSTYMHQDNYFFNGDSNEIISCAVYMEDTSKENGCLRLAHKSHTNGLVPHNHSSNIDGISWIEPRIANKMKIVDMEREAPYATFFDINLVHGCYNNKSNRTRFSLAWEYIKTSNKDVVNSDLPFCDRSTIG